MDKQLEERARQASIETLERLSPAFEEGYIKGATEQQEIVIDKACEWIENYDNEQLPYTDLDCDGHCYVDMVKLAEEFRKEMLKGE